MQKAKDNKWKKKKETHLFKSINAVAKNANQLDVHNFSV